jgi:hypothetical protein
MGWQNTAADWSGLNKADLCDADGYKLVRIVKASGHTAVQVTGDAQIKASAGVLYGLVIAGAGVTAGNTVAIKDGGAGGTVKITYVFGAANETQQLVFDFPITFSTDIYCDVTLSGGSAYVTGVYD